MGLPTNYNVSDYWQMHPESRENIRERVQPVERQEEDSKGDKEIKYHIEFVLYRNSSLPLNPGEYDLENEFEGKFFQVWSCEIEEKQYPKVAETLDALKGRDRIVQWNSKMI